MPKKFKKEGEPEVHKNLKGFNIQVNQFGEISGNYGNDKINSFLNSSDHSTMDNTEEE